MFKKLNNKLVAILGFLFILPFLLLNLVVVFRLQPLFSLIRPGIHTSTLEYILLVTSILVMPLGALIAFSPMLKTNINNQRNFYIFNSVVVAVLLVIFLVLAGVLGQEIYQCDVLQIPNCD